MILRKSQEWNTRRDCEGDVPIVLDCVHTSGAASMWYISVQYVQWQDNNESNCTGRSWKIFSCAMVAWSRQNHSDGMSGGPQVCQNPTSHTSALTSWAQNNPSISKHFLLMPICPGTASLGYCANPAASAYAPAAPCLLRDVAMQQQLGQPPPRCQGPLNVSGFGWYWKAAV